VVVIIEVLLKYELNINSINKDGETPFDRYLTYNDGSKARRLFGNFLEERGQ
jgi:hypothetical protein